MSPAHVVIDGSNIATEGRSTPSLRQLDEAVREFQDEFPEAEPIVVVDATFGHRIDPAERAAFDEAVNHGELVSPPAGAIGRGDAFVLRIAERVDGRVLSNDSFQEFHEEHPWLFEEDRLIGGKPVPGVGWIFTPRRPVRGPRSRSAKAEQADESPPATARRSRRRPRSRSAAVLEAVEAAAAEATEAATMSAEEGAAGSGREPKQGTGRSRRRRRRPAGQPKDPALKAAIEAATAEAVGGGQAASDGAKGGRRRKEAAEPVEGSAPQAVNDPLTFVRFISEHPLGYEVTGVVSTFVSHGAMVDVGDMHCYVPLSGLGSPPPNSARAVLGKGQSAKFVVVALDPPRRGVQLALSEVVASPGAGMATSAMDAVKAAKAPGGRAAKGLKAAAPAKPSKSAKAAKSAKPVKAAKAKAAKPSQKAAGTAKTATSKTAKATPRKAKPARSTAKATRKRSAASNRR